MVGVDTRFTPNSEVVILQRMQALFTHTFQVGMGHNGLIPSFPGTGFSEVSRAWPLPFTNSVEGRLKSLPSVEKNSLAGNYLIFNLVTMV
ncbi:unnamed protein product [Protopolystoma xenopodis]|uniref:Uncharacterized protein n=1 Tax=Protopolystoma xenopodis TaxID=117903 RepID=A0A3S5CL21_9PLAT|nr:unnamed protein product [Protopolystoma xenopodis]